jgi:predicted dehydrogenase/nucleoside-diphosphate-sugar epimerase
MTESRLHVALIGAGHIADAHAEALRSVSGATIAAVVDPVRSRAEALAQRWRIPVILDDARALGRDVAVEVAHVLTPPSLHRAAAEPLLERGIHVLIEKPMATSEAECIVLEEAAERGGARLRVNHNFVHHPAFARLHSDLVQGAVGRPCHVDIVYIVQLRQLAAGQLGHWMFRSPLNLLLEQVVHPVSQLEALIGWPEELQVVADPSRKIGDGFELVTGWQLVGRAGGASFHVRILLGHTQPLWRVRVVGSDGVVEADILRNRHAAELPTPWLEAADDLVAGSAIGLRCLAQTASNTLGYLGGQLGLRCRTDGFFASMRASIAGAHAAFRGRDPDPHPSPGRRLVALLERVAQSAPPINPTTARPCRTRTEATTADVVLVGGTGFIGRHLTAWLVGRGHRVVVVARQLEGLPQVFADSRVMLVRGDVADEGSARAIAAIAPVIVHLAHGGGTGWPAIERAMVGGARLLGTAARDAGTKRLIFVSSIAALYLGDPGSDVDQTTLPDPLPEARAPYTRGKIASEAALLAIAARDGLRLTIVRPGIVLGRGTSAFHSGVGLFNRETHCLGWNKGTNPLPFVLVSDLADAIGTMFERAAEAGPVYNLVGDVRLSAREYIAELARTTGRPLFFHPRSARWSAVVETAKWGVKRTGRRSAERTTLRDLRSRGLVAAFDTGQEKAELGWRPVADRPTFLAEAFAGMA